MDHVHVSAASNTAADFVRHRCHPSNTLDASHHNWWITDQGTMPGGRGEQYIEYDLGEEPRVVSFVHMTIPPLPSGPLSVRMFRIDAADAVRTAVGGGEGEEEVAPANVNDGEDDGEAEGDRGAAAQKHQDEGRRKVWPSLFDRASPTFTTLDNGTRQIWAIEPPIEGKRFLRVVCMMNAAADVKEQRLLAGAMDVDDWPVPSSVGFFTIGFS